MPALAQHAVTRRHVQVLRLTCIFCVPTLAQHAVTRRHVQVLRRGRQRLRARGGHCLRGHQAPHGGCAAPLPIGARCLASLAMTPEVCCQELAVHHCAAWNSGKGLPSTEFPSCLAFPRAEGIACVVIKHRMEGARRTALVGAMHTLVVCLCPQGEDLAVC